MRDGLLSVPAGSIDPELCRTLVSLLPDISFRPAARAGHQQVAYACRLSVVVNQWSGFNVRQPACREIVNRMSNPKLHQNPLFAGDPPILTFARVPPQTGGER